MADDSLAADVTPHLALPTQESFRGFEQQKHSSFDPVSMARWEAFVAEKRRRRARFVRLVARTWKQLYNACLRPLDVVAASCLAMPLPQEAHHTRRFVTAAQILRDAHAMPGVIAGAVCYNAV